MSESTSKPEFNISSSVHPSYTSQYLDWQKFRYIIEGGDTFIEQYLKSYSSREASGDFTTRKEITPLPAFASAAITDVRNAIFQRMPDITRTEGSKSYQDIVLGKIGGVDLLGATMNYFIGNRVLPELLNMGKVGVYTDMPQLNDNQTIRDVGAVHPYFYIYTAEQIRNWRLAKHGEFIEFDMLLLQENILTYDDIYHLPDKDTVRYRLLTLEDGVVTVRFFDGEGTQIDMNGSRSTDVIELNIQRIPFTLFEIDQSLLKNVANHQIALLNLESSDIAYALKANFPFYVEQKSNTESNYLKGTESVDNDLREIVLGSTVGRSYGKDMDAPSFISPSSEPLDASMAKQKQLKEDIRALINLALSAIQPKYASAQAKEFDEHGLESGLSFLGLILEHGERQLSSFYAEYEGNTEVAIINYPDRYSLKSDQERIDEANKLFNIMVKVPSKTAQKTMTKLAIQKLLDTKIPAEELETILKEIDSAEYTTSDPETIHGDLEKGLVSTETASAARGYNAKKEVEQAQKDHVERIKRIKEAQSNEEENQGARGVDDLDDDPAINARQEKIDSQDSDLQGDSKKAVRGKGK